MPTIASVTIIIEALQQLESERIKVHPQRCVRVRNRHARCSRCADACTSGAITLTDTLTIDSEHCVGCGTCATVCPTCALETMCPNDAELIQRVRQILSSGNDTINFVCNAAIDAAGKSLDQSKAIDVICLSRIEESLLCTCMVAGAKRIDLVRDQCEGCARQQSVATIDIVKETMDALMSAWGVKQQLVLRSSSSTDIFITEKSGEGGRGLSRREFLAELGHRAKTATTIAATTALKDVNGQTAQVKPQSIATTSVMKDGTLPHFIPNRRERLLDQLDALGSPIADNIDTRLWGHIILDNDRCSSCRMCATFCPTGAIYKFDDIDGTFGIEHYMADCVHCCLCEDICPERAIACINTVPIKDLVEGKIERHIMKPRTWQPNKGDSIWRKMQQVIPNANINERC